jgi:predicted phage terminase large subunit-like protein
MVTDHKTAITLQEKSMDLRVKALLLRKLLRFTQKAIRKKDGIEIGDDPYLVYLADHLEAFGRGDIRRLVINLPPSHLKSQLGAVCLAAWMLAANPTLKILIVTHTENLSKSHARDIRAILTSDWYKEAFNVCIKKGHAELTDFGTTKGGRIMSVSFVGNFTGLHADVIIVDDPHDMNDTLKVIEQTVATFNSKGLTRLNDPETGRVLVIAHRVHEHDLSSGLLRQGWASVILPLVATRDQIYHSPSGKWHRRMGDPLRPAVYNQKHIDQLRNNCINPDFEMLFQRDCDAIALPSFRPEDFPRFARLLPSNSPTVLSVDPGAGSKPNSAFSVIQAWRIEGQHYFLIDQFRDQCEYRLLRKKLRRFLKRYRPFAILIERTANGNALISDLSPRHGELVVLIDPDGRSKSARLRVHAQTIFDARIHLPLDAPWVDEFVAEFVDFRQSRRSVFADQIDATTQFLDHAPQFANLKYSPMTVTGLIKTGYRTRVFAAPATGTPGIASRGGRESWPLSDPIFDLPPKPGD